jgi:hypothetical protein
MQIVFTKNGVYFNGKVKDLRWLLRLLAGGPAPR